MKLLKTKFAPWAYDEKTLTYFRTAEAGILLNFEGHGSEASDTVEELIEKLRKLDPKATVMADEDDKSGRMGLFSFSTERRPATLQEQVQENQRATKELLAHQLLMQKRAAASKIMSEVRSRREALVLNDRLVIVEIALEGVQAQLQRARREEKDDLEADERTLLTERARLMTELGL